MTVLEGMEGKRDQGARAGIQQLNHERARKRRRGRAARRSGFQFCVTPLEGGNKLILGLAVKRNMTASALLLLRRNYEHVSRQGTKYGTVGDMFCPAGTSLFLAREGDVAVGFATKERKTRDMNVVCILRRGFSVPSAPVVSAAA